MHGKGVDRSYGYPVPYRCFYSRNIDNLFMAGRCISVTHEALGTTRVMKTCGMMGEVVGKAASICAIHDCQPRDVYEDHLDELLDLLRLPGKARRSTPSAEVIIPADAMTLAGPNGPPSGQDPQQIDGIVVDDQDAVLEGKWTAGQGLKNYVGNAYQYAGDNSDASARFEVKVPKAGTYQLQLFSQAHENRATAAPVTVTIPDQSPRTYRVDQRTKTNDDLITVDEIELPAGATVVIIIGCKDAGGTVHVDAVRLLQAK